MSVEKNVATVSAEVAAMISGTDYAYKVDPKTDEVTSELADKDNHAIDSIRYALENVRRGGFSHEELRI